MSVSKSDSKQAEADFFGDGTPLGDDYVDPDLVRLALRPSVVELVLVLVIMAALGGYAYLFRADFLYYFANDEPIELGPVNAWSERLAEDPDALMSVGSNVYVSLSGIPARGSETDELQWSQLVGAPIFVERPNENADQDPILRNVTTRPRVGPFSERASRSQRFYVDGAGRLLHFSEARADNVVAYYTNGYGMWFCGEELPPEVVQFRRMMREELATDMREELGRAPSDEEVQQRFDADFACVQGFLFQLGDAPDDYLAYVVIYGIFGLLELLGAAYVARWFVRLRRARTA